MRWEYAPLGLCLLAALCFGWAHLGPPALLFFALFWCWWCVAFAAESDWAPGDAMDNTPQLTLADVERLAREQRSYRCRRRVPEEEV